MAANTDKTVAVSEDEGFDSPSCGSRVRFADNGEGGGLLASPANIDMDEGFEPDQKLTESAHISQTRTLIHEFLDISTDVSKADEADAVQLTLVRCVNSFRTEHAGTLKTMMLNLNQNIDNSLELFRGISFELFEGHKNEVTWRRIVALLAFSSELLLYCQTRRTSSEVAAIRKGVEEGILELTLPFIRKQGGWEKICLEFTETDAESESSLWSVLKIYALVGLATATTAKILS